MNTKPDVKTTLMVEDVYYNPVSIFPPYQECLSDAKHCCGYTAINRRISSISDISVNVGYHVVMNEFYLLVYLLRQMHVIGITTKVLHDTRNNKMIIYLIGEDRGHTRYTTIIFKMNENDGVALHKKLHTTSYFADTSDAKMIFCYEVPPTGSAKEHEIATFCGTMIRYDMVESSTFSIEDMDEEDHRLHRNREDYFINHLFDRPTLH